MIQIEEDCEIQCPFCFERFSIRIDRSGGDSQRFVYDCEICCRPIEITLSCSDNGEIQIEAAR